MRVAGKLTPRILGGARSSAGARALRREPPQREPRQSAVGGDRSPRGGSAAPSRSGRRRRARPAIASSAGSNGNSARTTSITSKTPALTVPEGTSERKAIGSETMNASSELARTSRAAPPIAAPKAAKPAPPARIASDDQRSRAPVDRDQERSSAAEHQQRDRERGDDAEHDLLDQQPGRGRRARG